MKNPNPATISQVKTMSRYVRIVFDRHLKARLVIALKMRNAETAFYTHRTRFNALVKAGKGETAEAAPFF